MKKTRKARPLRSKRHRTWQLQEAKSRFSELINNVVQDGYQTITKNGEPVAVLLSSQEFEILQNPANTLLDFFLKAPSPELDLTLDRSKDTGREVEL